MQPSEKEEKVYTAALVIIGNEILSGRTPDANLAWLSEQLNRRGIRLTEARIIPDIESVIVSSVRELKDKADYLFTTGGIGPTHDDITTAAVAQALDLPLVRNEEAVRILQDYYRNDLNEARLKMAMLPKGVRLIENAISAAPGFYFENVYVLAGVPRIMQAMFDSIAGTFRGGAPILSNTITCRLGESVLARDLSELQGKFPDIDIGSYPHFRGGLLGLSLVLRGISDARLREATDQAIEIIRKLGDEPRAVSVRQ